MTKSTAFSETRTAGHHLTIGAANHFGLIELRNSSPLRAQLLPSGAVFAWRHGSTLLNQLLCGPAENGLFRLLLRWKTPSGQIAGWKSLVGAGEIFSVSRLDSAEWTSTPTPNLDCTTSLTLHPTLTAWSWKVALQNNSLQAVTVDVLHAQDLGLADEGAVRNNEAYTSQYIDLQPERDAELGWTILARQNQAMAQGRRPWMAVGCSNGATAFCTDGYQFFGADHRLTHVPAAAALRVLPSLRLQYEFALAGLQSREQTLAPGARGEITFIVRFLEDHPTASSNADLYLLRELTAAFAGSVNPRTDSDLVGTFLQDHEPAPLSAGKDTSLFVHSRLVHGDVPHSADWAEWFPGEKRHLETSADGELLSFFCEDTRHVVSLSKEASVARPHGHILRSGEATWFDADHFGLTCYAAGIFAAQAYIGHPSFARLLSVVRNPLNVIRGSGQRVFIQRGHEWQQLGLPSAFAMTLGEAQWIYRFDSQVIELRVFCHAAIAAASLELRVVAGPPTTFLISHELVLGASEFEHSGSITINSGDGYAICRPSADSMIGKHQPGVCFAIAAANPRHVAAFGGDGLLFPDRMDRGGPYLVIETAPVSTTTLILCGTTSGPAALPDVVTAVRAAHTDSLTMATPPRAPVRIHGGSDPAVRRINEILPWFTHNAGIHFSAPHGLEQYGGAAWGVRDVCQGSVEWLLAAGEFAIVRRILETVFAQQYATDGSWPQWFMFAPYQFIQQAHSHGDVCFWPVKALCDYVEASNDLGFLQQRVDYTDPQRFEPGGPHENLIEHCDRVIAQCQARFIAGTALVNYGDGDWDDTLQPSDPTLRTRMISAWTVGLAFHSFRQLRNVYQRIGDGPRTIHLTEILEHMRNDFSSHLMPDETVAGFLVHEPDGRERPLLHPTDQVTHIRYRLLPMTRSILAELFTPQQAKHHLDIIQRELSYPDGVRLMSEPCTYAGGLERLFKRAETASNLGREIGLQYVHAHLRYAEALAKVGDAEGLLQALQVVNPVDLKSVVAHAADRQSNMYFSSSDADFGDRYEAAKRWPELRTGQVPVRGGWRLYSSGPGLFIHKIRACLLGLRESFDAVIIDPVLPKRLDGLIATTRLMGRTVELHYRVSEGNFSPRAITVNGVRCRCDQRDTNPYRLGGCLIPRSELEPLLNRSTNLIEIEL